MGDAGSERSKAPSLPPRCPCGFWGSSKTMNLCSKCFADFQKKQPDDDSTPSTSNSQSDLFSEETTSDNKNTSLTTPTLSPSQQPLPTELNVTAPSKEECGPCTDTAHVSLITPTKRSCGTDSQSENEASPVKRPRLLENTERSEEASRSKQKSRRRCFQCQTKLELVQQELGSCRCGDVTRVPWLAPRFEGLLIEIRFFCWRQSPELSAVSPDVAFLERAEHSVGPTESITLTCPER